MLNFLSAAGFFAICWTPADAPAQPGATYVLPGPRGVVRVFVPAGGGDVEWYTGRLSAGQLRYRGPLTSEDQLQKLLATTR
ncbi:hypothetical protein [Hymenobacter sp. B1770]|uniref:hypothetical protein n=1 Tax=Hymenobacter sp. B1770 TaxID=1718788 RepID=UPI003CF32BC7